MTSLWDAGRVKVTGYGHCRCFQDDLVRSPSRNITLTQRDFDLRGNLAISGASKLFDCRLSVIVHRWRGSLARR